MTVCIISQQPCRVFAPLPSFVAILFQATGTSALLSPHHQRISMLRLHDEQPVQQTSNRTQHLLLGSLVATSLLLAACGKEASAPAGAGGQKPAVEVGTVTATPGDIGLVTELPGRVEASRVAQVRARAAGILQQRTFKEGSDVKAGQSLFKIDEAPYAAALDSAKASVIARSSKPTPSASKTM